MAQDIPELSYGTVKGRFASVVADASDEGRTPDARPLTGRVTFTATAPLIRYDSATLGPLTVVPRAVSATLDSEGRLAMYGDDDETALDVTLWATDDPNANPTGWQWQATFDLSTSQGKVEIPAFHFALPGGATVDLTTVAPVVKPSPGTAITRGPEGRRGSIWYTSSVENPDVEDVVGMLEGDMFVYAGGAFFRYNGSAWDYAGVLFGAEV